jgi:hypothetical protein
VLHQRERSPRDQVAGGLVPRHEQGEAEAGDLVVAETLAVELGLDEARDQILLGPTPPLARHRRYVCDQLADHLARLGADVAPARLDHVIRPATEGRVVLPGDSQQLGDHEHRHRNRDLFDELDAATRIDRLEALHRDVPDPTLHVLDTAGRKGADHELAMAIVVGGIHADDRGGSPARRSRDPGLAATHLEELRAPGGREQTWTLGNELDVGVLRHAPESTPLVPMQRILGAQPLEGGVGVSEVPLRLLGSEGLDAHGRVLSGWRSGSPIPWGSATRTPGAYEWRTSA